MAATKTGKVQIALRLALGNARWLLKPGDDATDEDMVRVARDLAGNLQAVDELIRKGGKLPRTWAAAVVDRECHCAGWLHQDNGDGTVIERCDTCRIFKTDDEAERAHRDDCGCGAALAERHAEEAA